MQDKKEEHSDQFSPIVVKGNRGRWPTRAKIISNRKKKRIRMQGAAAVKEKKKSPLLGKRALNKVAIIFQGN